MSERSAEDIELELELRDKARINPNALEDEFVELSGDLAYQAARHASALAEHLRAKARAKRLRGLVFIEVREKPSPATGKPRSEKDAEALVDNDPRVIEAGEEEIEAEVEREREKGMLAALAAKRDMLVQLGATRRAELEREPFIRYRDRDRDQEQER